MALVLATVDQLRTRLQDPDLDAVAAQQAIDDATAIVKAAAGQDLEFVPGDVVELRGGGRELRLPQRPVVVDEDNPLTVVELIDAGGGVPAVEGITFRRSADRLTRLGRGIEGSRVVDRSGVGHVLPTGVWSAWVQVTYSHGYTQQTLPAAWSTAVLNAASTIASNPGGLRSIALDGEVTLTYGTESLSAPRSLVADVRRDLRDLRLRRSGAFSIIPG